MSITNFRNHDVERLLVKGPTSTLFCASIPIDTAEAKAIELCQERQWGGTQDIAFWVDDRLAWVLVGHWTDEEKMILVCPSSHHVSAIFKITKRRLKLETPNESHA